MICAWAGCDPGDPGYLRVYDAFQPSPGATAGCDIIERAGLPLPKSFNPHPARRPGPTPPRRGAPDTWVVSTLTRRDGRVRHHPSDTRMEPARVSTLTRRDGRVRQTWFPAPDWP